ncbi:MAG: glycosyltransferase family 2 protein [Actinomycetota bacterium]
MADLSPTPTPTPASASASARSTAGPAGGSDVEPHHPDHQDRPAAPTVTVGLPVYNGERFLERSLRSVLDQTWTDLEVVVSDNGSTDRSLEIVREVAAGDPRVTIVASDTNRGAAWNYNNTLANARGRYFRWHADDDWFEPTLITKLVEALDGDDGAVVAHSWTRFVDDDGATTREFPDDLGVDSPEANERLARAVVNLTFCNPVFGLIRTDVLQRTAKIASFPGSDATLLYELAINGRFAVVPELLYNRRPGNSIKTNNSMRAVAEWFSPNGSGGRFPALAQFIETVRAILRAPLSTGERIRCGVAFVRHWPIDYARKSRRRARRRRQRAV